MKYLLSIIFVFLSLGAYSQSYSTYSQAFEAFKEFASNRGFKACERKYSHCKKLRSATIKSFNEQPDHSANRMDIEITYAYQYAGCYIGWDQYNGTARIRGYIMQLSNGQFQYGTGSIEVLHWDMDK